MIKWRKGTLRSLFGCESIVVVVGKKIQNPCVTRQGRMIYTQFTHRVTEEKGAEGLKKKKKKTKTKIKEELSGL
jgi:hypothetical protein